MLKPNSLTEAHECLLNTAESNYKLFFSSTFIMILRNPRYIKVLEITPLKVSPTCNSNYRGNSFSHIYIYIYIYILFDINYLQIFLYCLWKSSWAIWTKEEEDKEFLVG